MDMTYQGSVEKTILKDFSPYISPCNTDPLLRLHLTPWGGGWGGGVSNLNLHSSRKRLHTFSLFWPNDYREDFKRCQHTCNFSIPWLRL